MPNVKQNIFKKSLLGHITKQLDSDDNFRIFLHRYLVHNIIIIYVPRKLRKKDSYRKSALKLKTTWKELRFDGIQSIQALLVNNMQTPYKRKLKTAFIFMF